MSLKVPRTECAIISANDMRELRMLVPERVDGDGEMPGVMAFMLACFMRSRDPGFVTEQLAWLHQLEIEIENQLFGTQ
jgi:hypothetical protein